MAQVRIVGGREGMVLPYLTAEIGTCYQSGKRVIVIVPEQYTLQAEREIIDRLKLPGFFDLEVLSPSRLNRKIRETAGKLPLTPLDSCGRSMAIACALRSCTEELHYYKKVALSPGLPNKISSLLTDLEHAGLDDAALAEQAEKLPSSATKAKLTDLSLVWQRYRQVIDGRFADEQIQRQDLLSRLQESGVVTDACLFVYGFDVLRKPLCDLLTEALSVCGGLTIGMTMDSDEAPDSRVFYTQRESAKRFAYRLRTIGITVKERYLPGSFDDRDPALEHMEKQLFSRKREVFAPNVDAVEVHDASNPFAEAAYCAQVLTKWHDSGIAWSKMAVALAGTASPALMQTLGAAGIPAYLSQSDHVMQHGLVRMLLSSLAAAANGFRTADVMAAARSGFADLTRDESDLIENYALAYGINRSKWTKPFTKGEEAAAMEAVRLRLIVPMTALREEIAAAKTATEGIVAVYHFLETIHAYDKLLQREKLLMDHGMEADVVRNRQIWHVMMALLDQMYALLGEQKASLREICDLAEAALSATELNAFPPTNDTVMIGEAGHLMTNRLKALYVIGMQDGMLQSGMDSLLSDEERTSLSERIGRPVGVTRLEQSALRLSDIYRTLALPSQRLVLSCSLGEMDGGALRPAALLDDIRHMFPGCVRTGGIMDDGHAVPISPLQALEELSVRLRAAVDSGKLRLDRQWEDALRWLCQSSEYAPSARRLLETLLPGSISVSLPGDMAVKLFSGDRASVSRLERYAECPYHYYVDYGLKPEERKEFVYQPSDVGSFYHEALEKFATDAANTPDWPNISDEEVDRMMDHILEPMTEQWADGPLRDDAMGRHLSEGYLRDVHRAAKMMTNHAKNSRFVTKGTEVPFGEADGGLPPIVLQLQDGRSVALHGKIDRIDLYENEQGRYVRIVDYKSSDKRLNDTKMWNGLQLQLPIYLKAAADGIQGAAPAGAFYFKVDDPVVEANEDAAATVEKQIANELKLRGVVLADEDVIKAMDPVGEYVLPKMIKANGDFTENAMDAEDLSLLLRHAQQSAAELTESIRSGKIPVSPAKTEGEWTACQYCDYSGICGIDSVDENSPFRELKTIKRDDLIALLRGKYNS